MTATEHRTASLRQDRQGNMPPPVRHPHERPRTDSARTQPLLLRVALVVLAAALLGVAIGCGDDTEGGTQAAPRSTVEPTPDPAEDERIAQAAQLRLKDFPSHWREGDREEQTGPANCYAVVRARASAVVRDESPRFSPEDSPAADSIAYLFADAQTAAEHHEALASEATRACVAEDAVASARKAAAGSGPGNAADIEVGEPRTRRVAIDPVGDEREGSRITLPLRIQGEEVDLVLDYVVVRVDRGLVLLTFIDLLAPFDENLRADLTSKVTRRLAAGLG
jgi:hypothetical protein